MGPRFPGDGGTLGRSGDPREPMVLQLRTLETLDVRPAPPSDGSSTNYPHPGPLDNEVFVDLVPPLDQSVGPPPPSGPLHSRGTDEIPVGSFPERNTFLVKRTVFWSDSGLRTPKTRLVSLL